MIAFDPRAFSIWDPTAGKWAVAPGKLVGNSSRNLPLKASVDAPPAQ